MGVKAFDSAIEETSEGLVGPRRLHQMLNAQVSKFTRVHSR